MEFRQDVRLGMARPIVPPLLNGGGCCKTIVDVRELSSCLAGAVLVGSITMEPRLGNEGEVWWVGQGAALNSLGMPNGGIGYLKESLPQMVEIAHDAGKALVVNVAGLRTEEYAVLAGVALEHGADAVEANLGCPNVLEDGRRKSIFSFDLAAIDEILARIQQEAGKSAPVWLKVSPYSDSGLLGKAAQIIAGYDVVKAVTAVNTFPNAYGFDESGRSAIGVGLAGLSGRALKHIGLGQVKQWRESLPGRVSLLGVGGISTGADIRDYGSVGADAFQVTTELLKHGRLETQAFERMALQYDALPNTRADGDRSPRAELPAESSATVMRSEVGEVFARRQR
jgi:dihydroorotate dehydrogenase (fumarate)